MNPRSVAVVSLSLLLAAAPVLAQTDPGVRGGPPGAGGPLPSIGADNPPTSLAFFNDGKDRFQEVDSVFGAVSGEPGSGLGPRFNSLSCARCHAQPAVGGSSPSLNPEVFDATDAGATNVVPPFVHLNGPVVEARFLFFTDTAGNPITSQPNGGVEPLYTITGRSDSNGCNIAQPNFASAMAHNNVILRIPTPVFGAGLIETIDDSTLLKAVGGNPFGISGTFNRNGNDGTISRFGWKAQNKSLLIFSGEAYNVEMGVSNEMFPQERPSPEEERAVGLPALCRVNNVPEDHTRFGEPAIDTSSDAVAFAIFMRFLDAPRPATLSGAALMSALHGQTVFNDIGCAACHRQQFTTGNSDLTQDMFQVPVKLYSDLEIHHMGSGLADNVQQGNAGGDQFRTAPLWGVGQRIFFLHDGRATTLMDAINAHSSTGSEANAVITNYGLLSVSDKQDLINFLRSL